MNRRFAAVIQLYDMLHGFQEDRGTGNASLEDNMLQQLIVTR